MIKRWSEDESREWPPIPVLRPCCIRQRPVLPTPPAESVQAEQPHPGVGVAHRDQSVRVANVHADRAIDHARPLRLLGALKAGLRLAETCVVRPNRTGAGWIGD